MLLAMAASQERAERIRELKAERPDLTWDRIGDYVDVKERSAIEWSRTGGISHENCEKLAVLFEVDPEWLWSGRTRAAGTGDLMDALHNGERRDPVQRELALINAKLDILLQRDGLALADLTEELTRYFEETLGTRHAAAPTGQRAGRRQDAKTASGRSRSQGTRRTA